MPWWGWLIMSIAAVAALAYTANTIVAFRIYRKASRQHHKNFWEDLNF